MDHDFEVPRGPKAHLDTVLSKPVTPPGHPLYGLRTAFAYHTLIRATHNLAHSDMIVLNIVTQQLTTHTAPTDTKHKAGRQFCPRELFIVPDLRLELHTCTHVHFPSGRGSPRAAAAARWLTQVKPKRAERDVFGREMS